MNKFRFVLQTFAVLVFTLTFVSLAQAQATRTWVSGVGDDVNPCSRTAPCKTWAGAISKTAAGGEIDALDPGGYGTLTITKSITVDGTSGAGWGSTLNSGGINGFNINDSLSGAPGTIVVQLRNISINGPGTTLGLNGIRFISGKSLHVENVRIQNQSGDGILLNPTSVNPVEINIERTTISNVGGSGINMSSAAGVINVSIDSCVLKDNNHGLTNNIGTANISNSVVTGNTTNGIQAISNQAVINASNNTVTDNASGIRATVAGAVIRISGNFVSRNTTAGLNNAGTMETLRNNRVVGNTSNLTGLLTDISAVGTGTF
jgi:hypothetical protein